MKKIIILLSILLVIFAASFIPYQQQNTTVISASFFNVYEQLINANDWKKWRVDLRQIEIKYPGNMSEIKYSNGFKILSPGIKLDVRRVGGYSFQVDEANNDKTFEYAYTVLPGKFQNETTIVVTQKTNLINYVLAALGVKSSSQTHIADFKNFMENVSLYYGYEIAKKKVTDTDIIVLRTVVLAKNKFADAAKNLSILKNYIIANGLKQTQPLIAQFFPRNKDSVQLNIGLPVNKKSIAKSPVYFMEMPKTGSVYTVRFTGRFFERQKAYAAGQRYFSDRHLQIPILPFETYLDGKLPKADTDRINIQINFPTF